MANIKKADWDSVFDEIREDLRGDFIGFTWDGMSMSRLGIARVSSGNRYNENLLPTMQDKTNQIPGADGTYYFNSFYTQKPFSISFAFDHLTEKGLRQLKQLFGDKGIHRLSFDEQPYKEYMVKVTGQPQLKYIPFDDESKSESKVVTDLYGVEKKAVAENRIYKGEGTLTLTAFAPYARSRAKSIEGLYALEEEQDVYMDYKDQWQDASGIVDALTFTNDAGETIIYDGDGEPYGVTNEIRVYNPGDKEADFMLIMKPTLNQPIQLNMYEIPNTHDPKAPTIDLINAYLVFSIPGLEGEEKYIRINSKVELIEEVVKLPNGTYQPTGVLYNQYISYGWFFKIPQSQEGYYYILGTDSNFITQENKLSIEYNYWYF